MTLSSSNLEAFWMVSQTLNFSRAAEKLHITQSALSQRVLNLEKELETTLFIRDRSGLKLTDVGANLVRYCQIKNSLENEFLAGLRVEDPKALGGVLRIGGFSTITASILVPSIAPLLVSQRNLRAEIMGREFDELLGLLKRGEIDYMILDDRIEREELQGIHLGSERNVLVEAKKYRGPEIYLDHDQNDETTFKFLRKWKLPSKDIQRIFLDDIFGILEGVRQGIGRAIVPLHLVQDQKDLVILHPKQTLDVPLYLYFYTQPYYSKLHAHVVDAIQVGFKERLV